MSGRFAWARCRRCKGCPDSELSDPHKRFPITRGQARNYGSGSTLLSRYRTWRDSAHRRAPHNGRAPPLDGVPRRSSEHASATAEPCRPPERLRRLRLGKQRIPAINIRQLDAVQCARRLRLCADRRSRRLRLCPQ